MGRVAGDRPPWYFGEIPADIYSQDSEDVLRLATQGTAKDVSERKKDDKDEDALLVGELGLPSWVTKTDMGGALETLGNLYARRGNVEYAMPLYLQTISLLLPPPQAHKQELLRVTSAMQPLYLDHLNRFVLHFPS